MFTLKLQPSVCKLEAVVFFYPIDNLPILWYIGYVMYNSIGKNWFAYILNNAGIFAMLAIVAFIVATIIIASGDNSPCSYSERWECGSPHFAAGQCGCVPTGDHIVPYPKEY